MRDDDGVIPFPSVGELLSDDDEQLIRSRPVNTPHQLELRRRAAERGSRKQQGVFYLGRIPEGWAIACQKAHPAGYLLACAVRARAKMRGEPVPVSQALGDRLGIGQDTRRRALAALEAAGLVRVERKPGCAPLATLLPWRPKKKPAA